MITILKLKIIYAEVDTVMYNFNLTVGDNNYRSSTMTLLWCKIIDKQLCTKHYGSLRSYGLVMWLQLDNSNNKIENNII